MGLPFPVLKDSSDIGNYLIAYSFAGKCFGQVITLVIFGLCWKAVVGHHQNGSTFVRASPPSIDANRCKRLLIVD
jgi:hypothetical protein